MKEETDAIDPAVEIKEMRDQLEVRSRELGDKLADVTAISIEGVHTQIEEALNFLLGPHIRALLATSIDPPTEPSTSQQLDATCVELIALLRSLRKGTASLEVIFRLGSCRKVLVAEDPQSTCTRLIERIYEFYARVLEVVDTLRTLSESACASCASIASGFQRPLSLRFDEAAARKPWAVI